MTTPIKPTSGMHRTTLTLFLVLIPFVASCKKNASREASKPPPEIGALATTAANKLERTSGLFVTQNLEDMDAKAGTSAVSLSRPHRAVLALKGLQPGSDYQATFSLSDEQGAELLPSQSVLTFKPEAPDWTVFATFRPDCATTIVSFR